MFTLCIKADVTLKGHFTCHSALPGHTGMFQCLAQSAGQGQRREAIWSLPVARAGCQEAPKALYLGGFGLLKQGSQALQGNAREVLANESPSLAESPRH